MPKYLLEKVAKTVAKSKNVKLSFGKSSQNIRQIKKAQIIITKAQFQSPKHQHQTSFELLK
jgi:hypothetical protein